MLFTLTNTQAPATDLGFLLHKHPARVQTFPLSFGEAHVFYPEATEERCTAALLLDIDPVGLVRRPVGESAPLAQYVNDRPYVASSFLSVALAEVFRSALGGVSKERPELTDAVLPLEATLDVLPCRGGEALLRRLFEPLGYTVVARRVSLDERHPEWGEGPYYSVTLSARCKVSDLLTHLYVLIPVLDDAKHYWVGDDEVEKLLRFGQAWFAEHPERELIADRYLKHRRSLVRSALERIVSDEEPDVDETEERQTREEEAVEAKVSLNEHRMTAVLQAIKAAGAKSVLDLGCGEGKLLVRLVRQKELESIVGVDVSHRSLEIAEDRIGRLPDAVKQRVKLLHGSLVYRDKRLEGFDVAAVVEVIEHLDPSRLAAFERVLFEYARPKTIVLTTPNAEFNVRFESLPKGQFRHRDHRFEWTRAEFEQWARGVATRFGYSVTFAPVGPVDDALGAPTQMGVFSR